MRSRSFSFARRALAALTLVTAAALTACGGGDEDADDGASDLTSNTGDQRSLTFQGTFYVATGTSDATIASQAALQAKAAFGALRTSNMVAASRYMTGIVPGSIKKRPVKVIDTANPGAAATSAVRVTYTYKDSAVVPKTMTSSVFSTALLNPRYDALQAVVRKNCTPGQTESGEPIWYSLNTSGAGCQADISAEADAIQADRTHLPVPTSAGASDATITRSELQRVFFPTAFALGPKTTNTKAAYPEYDQLYSGHGVEAGKLVVGLIGGYATHKAVASEAPVQGKYVDAAGAQTIDAWIFAQFLDAILVATAANPRFASTSDVSLAFSVNGHAYSFADLLALARFVTAPAAHPPVMSATASEYASDFRALMQQIMDRVSKRWLTFEAPTTVTSGGQSHPLTLKLQAYFGTDEENVAVFKTAFKHNDVLGYMGHSYTGHGPYAPQNMAASDFASSYQLMFFNGCVSYNYYDQSFFKLKAGGTKKLDLVTNSIEGQFSNLEGAFAAAFFDGSMPSYSDLLKRLESPSTIYGSGENVADDPFRVVDGELDNAYAPTAMPIVLR